VPLTINGVDRPPVGSGSVHRRGAAGHRQRRTGAGPSHIDLGGADTLRRNHDGDYRWNQATASPPAPSLTIAAGGGGTTILWRRHAVPHIGKLMQETESATLTLSVPNA